MADALRRLCALGVAGALGLTVAGCGGEATVSHEDAAQAPASRDRAGESVSEESSKETTTERSPAPVAGGEDSGAREVDEVPARDGARSPEERGFLEALDDGGIDIKNNENELVGLARLVCGADAPEGDADAGSAPGNPGAAAAGQVTVEAVAGQLVEQKKTDLKQDEAARLLEDTARAQYC